MIRHKLFRQIWRPIVIGTILMMVTACSNLSRANQSTATPSRPSATARFNTSAPALRATLPPEWTRTPVPTATLTPKVEEYDYQALPTRTALPPVTLAELCASLNIEADFKDGETFQSTDILFFYYETPYTQAFFPPNNTANDFAVRFVAQHESLGSEIGWDSPAGEDNYFWLGLDWLLVFGRYEWSISVVPNGTNDIYCEERGSFIIDEFAQIFPTVSS